MSKHPENPIYYKRAFLNCEGHHGTAHVLATVNRDSWCHSLHLTDCSRSIELEFSMGSPGTRRNSLHKADLLAKTLTEFADALREYARQQPVPSRRPNRPRT